MIKNVMEYLKATVEQHPNQIAICDGDMKLTFRELDYRARQIASAIQRVTKGALNKPVGIYLPKSIDCLISFFGTAYSGNFYSPLDTKMPKSRLDRIMGTLQPAVLICHEENKKIAEGREAIILESAYEEKPISDEECLYHRVLDIDPLYVLFTSGSTGTPKGVVISHRGVIDYTEWLKTIFHFDETTVFGNQAPFYFDNSILDIYSMLKNGSTMVLLPEKLFMLPGKLLSYMQEKNVNTIFWVPSALVGVADSGMLENVRVDGLSNILFCGEVMPTRQMNVWRKSYPSARFANLYGPTEITDVCTYYLIDREFNDDEPLPIGRACENTQILILKEDGNLAEIGEKGELCVRGCGVSMGYYGMWERTGEAFIQNPLNPYYRDIIYRTGDLVYLNDQDEIMYAGRKDFQIKHQGHRIELGEIEAALGGFSGIRQACAVYHQEQKKICLFCIPGDNNSISEKEIYTYLKAHVPKYMLPSLICLVEDYPLNLNGKIDRLKLMELCN